MRAFAPLQLLSILIVLAIALAVSRSVEGYVFEGDQWPAGTVVTFQMGLGSAGRTLIDGNTSWDTAAAPALAAWNNVMARLQFNGNVANPPVSSGDGVNAIVFSNTVFGQQFGSGTLAVTYWRTSGSDIIEADILFNRNQQFDSYRGPLRFGSNGWAIGDIRRVLTHELGHALGLDHPDQHGQHVDAIMNSLTSDRETLSSDDIPGAQALYGTPSASSASLYYPTPLYDFNHDGQPDYLPYDASTRQTAVWYLNNNACINGAYAPAVPANWRIVGVGDFDQDGQADYLLFNPSTRQSAIWYLSGTALVAGVYGPSLPSGWQLVTASDFDGDNKPDYVLYNASTRQTAVWYLNNNTLSGGAYGPTLAANWRLLTVSDFNGDGHPDYLLFNSSTRQTAIWYLSGPSFVAAAYGPSINIGYALIGAADFNSDGHPDYVLFNQSTRQTVLWYLDNNAFIGSASGPSLPSGWTLTQP